MNGSEFAKIVDIIRGAFPHMDRFKDDDVKDVWFECLEDLEYGKARTATLNAIKSAREFPPSIADIRAEYEVLEEAERKIRGEIKNSYDNIKSYYPGSGGANYGWAEFQERAKTPEDARALSQMIFQFVRQCENEKCDNTPDFAEVIKGIRREGERLVIE